MNEAKSVATLSPRKRFSATGNVCGKSNNTDVYRAFKSPSLTIAIIKEVGDRSRGAAAPGFGGVNRGEDGGHEPLVTVHSETLFAELGVVVGQTEEVACGTEKKDTGFELICGREK